MKHHMSSKMYIDIGSKLSLEYEVFIDSTLVCVKEQCK
jgi:hypothetical protein